MTDLRSQILAIIRGCTSGLSLAGKTGITVLQPVLVTALQAAGFDADAEDSRGVLGAGIPVWRSKDDGAIVPTKRRRRVDIVVYRGSDLAALIETESDLNDLRESGVSRRTPHYDVASIAAAASGRHFDSYNSLERMAVAAFCWTRFRQLGRDPSAEEAVAGLEAIRSDLPADHNPGRVPLILVSGYCRRQDPAILDKRLRSLEASLVCLSGVESDLADE